MSRIDESRPFLPVQIAILTVSDTRTAADDKSGDTLAELVARDGHKVAARAIVKDDVEAISKQVQAWIADPQIDAIIRITPRPALRMCGTARRDMRMAGNSV